MQALIYLGPEKRDGPGEEKKGRTRMKRNTEVTERGKKLHRLR